MALHTQKIWQKLCINQDEILIFVFGSAVTQLIAQRDCVAYVVYLINLSKWVRIFYSVRILPLHKH